MDLKKQIQEARKRGREKDRLRARAAYYDSVTKELVVVLVDGKEARFPVGLLQGLQGASDDVLAQVQVTPGGSGVTWEVLDVDLEVEGLLEGRYGTEEWMKKLGR